MNRNKIHNKLYTSIAVSTTLLALISFNEQTVQASEINQGEETVTEIKNVENKSDDVSVVDDVNTADGTESDLATDEETEKTSKQEDEIENTLEKSEPDQAENLEQSMSENEDDVEEEQVHEEAIDIKEVRKATLSVFNARSTSKPSYTQSFIDDISPIAMNLGKEYGLYPSVMIAQSALESGWGGKSPALADDYVLSLPPNYNLFGVKGKYHGESVAVNTKEFDDNKKEYIDIVDHFKKYPSYTESLLDYVNKMKYNTTTKDPYFYSGVWVENTESYKDATDFLTGRYATDPTYGDKLNRIIENYNLTQYDEQIIEQDTETASSYDSVESVTVGQTENILETNIVAYYAILNQNVLVYSVPGFTEGFEVVATTENLSSREVTVTEEVNTDKQTWLKIESNGNEVGWVPNDDLTLNYLGLENQREVAYNAEISNPNINIYSSPAWTEDNVLVENSRDYIGQSLLVVEEVDTNEATYALVQLDGENLGWINVNGINGNYDSILETRGVAYNAEIVNSNINIYSKPAWTEGNKLTAQSSDYIGQNLVVKEEIVTNSATYARVESNGDILGWINLNGITGNYDAILETREVAYDAEIINLNINIYNVPAWTRGNKIAAQSIDYKGQNLVVKEEIVTSGGTYARLESDGEVLGWININGITGNYDTILEKRDVAYNAEIVNSNINIYGVPAWTRGNRLVAQSTNYVGQNLIVKEEIVTDGGTYAQVESNGQILGWININGIKGNYHSVLETRQVAYNAELTNPNINIYNVPAWTRGNNLSVKTSDYIGQNIVVNEEAITVEGTYAKVVVDGESLGWINVKGLTPKYYEIKETNDNAYGTVIKTSNSNIYSNPAWTKGNSLVGYSSDYVGEVAYVSKEIITDEAKYALITINGSTLGWINTNALIRKPVVYIDPGHGGDDNGASAGGVLEKDLNLSVSKKVESLLQNEDYIVVMSRDVDEFISLSGRAQEANSLGADIFVSVHHNAFNGSTHGIETFYYNGRGSTSNPEANDAERLADSKELAEEIHKELIDETGANDRGVKRANFHVVRETEMPAVLVEGGFIDNTVERAKLVLDSYQQKLADAITNGINKFLSFWN